MFLAAFEAYTRNRFANAVTLGEKAVELDPEHAYRVGILAGLLMDLEDDRRATELLTDALQRWPDRTNLNILAANLALYRGDHETAVQYAKKTLETSPKHPGGVYVLSQIDFAPTTSQRRAHASLSTMPTLWRRSLRKSDRGISDPRSNGRDPAQDERGRPRPAPARWRRTIPSDGATTRRIGLWNSGRPDPCPARG